MTKKGTINPSKQDEPKKSTQKFNVSHYRVLFLHPAPLESEKDTYPNLIENGHSRDAEPWWLLVPELGISQALVVNGKPAVGYLNQDAAMTVAKECIFNALVGEPVTNNVAPMYLEAPDKPYHGKVISASAKIVVLVGQSA